MLRTLLIATVANLASPALAAVDLGVTLGLSGNAEIKDVVYDCGTEQPLLVQYVYAEPNFLAIIPIDGEDRVFVNVVSASGAKYVAGEYEWWNKGPDATLHNVTEGLDAAPVLTCAENVQTP
ncbi:MAG: MliC family protein [Devosia sp.]